MSSGDLLLYVLSARSELSWSVYKSVFDVLAGKEQLQYKDVGLARALAVRNLDALAFCEFFGGSSDRKVTSVPTDLVRLPTMEPKAVLAGARAVSTFETVLAICRDLKIQVSTAEQEGEMAHLCPSRIELTADSDVLLQKFAAHAGIPFSQTPSSWALAQTSGGLDEIIGTLSWQEVPELTWPRMDFDVDRYHFRATPESLRKEVRLTRYKDPKRGIVRYHVWNGVLSAQIDADWGRYFVLKQMNRHIMYFDPEKHLLIFPKTVRLPRLLGRAVNLCSGLLPKVLPPLLSTSRSEYVAYEFVPEPLASMIAEKLGQHLQPRTFSFPS
jgi:hypothetical protein